ncbi:Monoamine oxidase [Budvicia aquatica]|uniref:Monoamine oxidase n=1 Tax=Budvicia aquatica TaxID=82979 RepID=A0A484ZDC7_9GAMM|nr:Monoamine oxidase [Budvicia aquatica]
MSEQVDVVIIGAGAAGLFCAAQAGQAGCSVVVLDNGKKPGRKILMSGGGRCNFTNMYAEPAAYLSNNPHFCKSALARYTQWDFIELVNRHGIPYHEKALGNYSAITQRKRLSICCSRSAMTVMFVCVCAAKFLRLKAMTKAF